MARRSIVSRIHCSNLHRFLGMKARHSVLSAVVFAMVREPLAVTRMMVSLGASHSELVQEEHSRSRCFGRDYRFGAMKRILT